LSFLLPAWAADATPSARTAARASLVNMVFLLPSRAQRRSRREHATLLVY
jgi:hypothetical protein